MEKNKEGKIKMEQEKISKLSDETIDFMIDCLTEDIQHTKESMIKAQINIERLETKLILFKNERSKRDIHLEGKGTLY